MEPKSQGSELVQSQAGWEPTTVREVLEQHDIDGNWTVGVLSFGHRSVLAMEVAVRSLPAVVVFDNLGCSEETVDRMLGVLRPHLAGWAAILVSFPTSPPRTCRPEFHCVAVHSIYEHCAKLSA